MGAKRTAITSSGFGISADKEFESLLSTALSLYKTDPQEAVRYLRMALKKGRRNRSQYKQPSVGYELEKRNYRKKIARLKKNLREKDHEVARLGKEVLKETIILRSLHILAGQALDSSPGNAGLIKTIIKNLEQELDARHARQLFEETIKQVHQSFQLQLLIAVPTLTKTEQKICSLIKLGLSSKEISELLYVSVRTIEGHRLNIRKKMHLADGVELFNRLNEIG